jgi:type II secretory pathway component PulF
MRGSSLVAPESIANVARQLRYALEQSTTIDEAFHKLYAAADQRQQATLRQLEKLLRAPQSDDAMDRSMRRSPYPTLAWLLHQTTSPEKSAAGLFREYRRHESFSSTTIVAVWSEFAGFLTYLGAVLAVLIVVVGMYGLIILPEFRSLYSGLGVNLPGLTRIAFGRGAPLFSSLQLVAAVLLGLLYWFVYLLRARLRRYAPLSAVYQRIPLVGPVVVAYHQYLWLSYAGLLRAAGIQAGEALRIAGTRVPLGQTMRWDAPIGASDVPLNAGFSAVDSDLAVAARLGRLDDEMQYQQEATVDTFLAALARCRRLSRIILTIIIYYLVATFVSAMYLPIFSLGSAI